MPLLIPQPCIALIKGICHDSEREKLQLGCPQNNSKLRYLFENKGDGIIRSSDSIRKNVEIVHEEMTVNRIENLKNNVSNSRQHSIVLRLK